LDISGVFDVRFDPETALRRLTDVKEVSSCLPNLTELQVFSESEFTASFKLDVSRYAKEVSVGELARLTARMRFRFLRRDLEAVVLEGNGRVMGSGIKITLDFNISPESPGSRVKWKASLDLGLILRLLGSNIVEKASREMAREVVECISSKML
jgi:carbon monoxide dehydrogenase subunit G